MNRLEKTQKTTKEQIDLEELKLLIEKANKINDKYKEHQKISNKLLKEINAKYIDLQKNQNTLIWKLQHQTNDLRFCDDLLKKVISENIKLKKLKTKTNKIKIFTEDKCSICLENKPSMCFPCGHVCFCEECEIKINICPICRNDPIESNDVSSDSDEDLIPVHFEHQGPGGTLSRLSDSDSDYDEEESDDFRNYYGIN